MVQPSSLGNALVYVYKDQGTYLSISRGGGTGEAGEATASLEFRGFTTEKFLASWIYERGNFSCFLQITNFEEFPKA